MVSAAPDHACDLSRDLGAPWRLFFQKHLSHYGTKLSNFFRGQHLATQESLEIWFEFSTEKGGLGGFLVLGKEASFFLLVLLVPTTTTTS